MMKMHSYLAVNGAMSQASARLHRTEQQLEERVLEVERDGSTDAPSATKGEASSPEEARAQQQQALDRSWERAIKTARDAADTVEESRPLHKEQSEGVPPWTLRENQRGMKAYRHHAFSGTIARNKNEHGSGKSGLGEKIVPPTAAQAAADLNNNTNSTTDHHDSNSEVVRDPHPLATHSDPVVSSLARDIEGLREELMSVDPRHADGAAESRVVGKESRVCWPDNVTYANFWDYLLVPTLVYELEYPRTKS